MITWYWSADTLFLQVSIATTWMSNIKHVCCKPRLHSLADQLARWWPPFCIARRPCRRRLFAPTSNSAGNVDHKQFKKSNGFLCVSGASTDSLNINWLAASFTLLQTACYCPCSFITLSFSFSLVFLLNKFSLRWAISLLFQSRWFCHISCSVPFVSIVSAKSVLVRTGFSHLQYPNITHIIFLFVFSFW